MPDPEYAWTGNASRLKRGSRHAGPLYLLEIYAFVLRKVLFGVVITSQTRQPNSGQPKRNHN